MNTSISDAYITKYKNKEIFLSKNNEITKYKNKKITKYKNNEITKQESRETDIAKPSRTCEVHFRCTVEEREKLRALAAGAGVSMTDVILISTVYREDADRLSQTLNVEQLESLYRELHAQGVNLNQMAHAVNGLVKNPKRLSDTRLVRVVTALAEELYGPQQDILDALASALGARRSLVRNGRGKRGRGGDSDAHA